MITPNPPHRQYVIQTNKQTNKQTKTNGMNCFCNIVDKSALSLISRGITAGNFHHHKPLKSRGGEFKLALNKETRELCNYIKEYCLFI